MNTRPAEPLRMGTPTRRGTAENLSLLALASCRSAEARHHGTAGDSPWEIANPAVPLPSPPFGLSADSASLGVTPAKACLGRWLFFDVRLSRHDTVSCASCHRPENAFSEPSAHSTGTGGQEGTRKAPPFVNLAALAHQEFFWDGRANSLAEQAKGPIENPVEMGNTLGGAVAKIARLAGYRRAFREAYGDGRLDVDRIADALAAYEDTRLSGGSAHDRFEAGDDDALSPLALSRRAIFFGRGRCDACHLGPAFTDARSHTTLGRIRTFATASRITAVTPSPTSPPTSTLSRPPPSATCPSGPLTCTTGRRATCGRPSWARWTSRRIPGSLPRCAKCSSFGRPGARRLPRVARRRRLRGRGPAALPPVEGRRPPKDLHPFGSGGRGEREHGLARGWLEPLWCQTPLAPSSP